MPIDPILDGAPKTAEECQVFWTKMMDGFKVQHGEEYMAKVMAPPAAK